MLRAIFTLSLALVSISAAADGLYRWVDVNGKVHYTDTAPTDRNVKTKKRALAAPAAEAGGLSYENQVAAKTFRSRSTPRPSAAHLVMTPAITSTSAVFRILRCRLPMPSSTTSW